MKKAIFTLIILLAGISQLSAQSKKAVLKVMLQDGSPLTVTVNNRAYDRHGRSITIVDLPAGNHYLKVYEYKPYRNERGGRAKLLYSGYVRTRRNTMTTCNVDPVNGSIRLRTMSLEDEWNDRRDEEQSEPNNSSRFTQRDIDDLKQRVNDHITDTDRLKLMKSALGNRQYYSADVQQMMRWLSFESTRLEFAKWAFGNVMDSKNYWKLESEFSFSSSKDEFNEFIQGK